VKNPVFFCLFCYFRITESNDEESLFTINIEELSPLDLLMNNRRSELEIMFEVKLREKYIVDNSTVVPLFIWPLSL
jgi:hypothetical protein